MFLDLHIWSVSNLPLSSDAITIAVICCFDNDEQIWWWWHCNAFHTLDTSIHPVYVCVHVCGVPQKLLIYQQWIWREFRLGRQDAGSHGTIPAGRRHWEAPHPPLMSHWGSQLHAHPPSNISYDSHMIKEKLIRVVLLTHVSYNGHVLIILRCNQLSKKKFTYALKYKTNHYMK